MNDLDSATEFLKDSENLRFLHSMIVATLVNVKMTLRQRGYFLSTNPSRASDIIRIDIMLKNNDKIGVSMEVRHDKVNGVKATIDTDSKIYINGLPLITWSELVSALEFY